MRGIEIELLYLPECPNRRRARAHLDRALAETGVAAKVTEEEVGTIEEAARLGMRGSPTFLVDGVDPFGDGTDPSVLSCRLYGSATGLSGAPTVEQLIEILAR